MKIAGVTMVYNDGYKLKEWKSHYNIYRPELDYYVIVDNGSENDFISEIYNSFPGETIIERGENGGCTAAYNSGIKYILDNTDAEAIVIIANDLKTSDGCLTEMKRYLEAHPEVGIVSTALLNIGSDIVDDFGHLIMYTGIIKKCDNGKRLRELTVKEKYTDVVAGGFYMATRDFYEKVGFQDEKLFMYSDEMDTSLRAFKAGYKIAVLSNVFVWHWHINQPGLGTRKPASNYLVSRNRVYVAKKHFNFIRFFVVFLTFTLLVPINLIRHGFKEKAKYAFIGGINGFCGNMEMNQYTQF